jgi:membrane-bound lytic murein transglycosylase D
LIAALAGFMVTLCAAGPGRASVSCGAAHFESLHEVARYGLPPHADKDGFVFAQKAVPMGRRDVRERIVKEINYLLLDRRSRVLLWLARADALRPVIAPILRQYDLPPEFLYLAAIESSYNSRALSSAGAYGYWQFIKSTALCGPKGCDQYDWKMQITNWKDERADLINSTHAAARYLAWLNRVKRVSINGKGERDGFNDWLLTAASYNAGPSRVAQRLAQFGSDSYWDVPLPAETERYVPRWIALSIISKHRDFYGVQIPHRGHVPFETVHKLRLQKDLSFTAMAKLLDRTPREIWALNTQVAPEKGVFPARSGRTAIQHTIHVPKGTRQKFLAQLAAHGYTRK